MTKGWTAADVKRLEDAGRVRGVPALGLPSLGTPTPATITEGPKRARGPSKWEAAYHAERLRPDIGSGAISWCAYEGISIQVGTSAVPCWYTADWATLRRGWVELHEVKGHMREAARVRMSALVRVCPWVRLLVATGGPGKWVVTEWRATG